MGECVSCCPLVVSILMFSALDSPDCCCCPGYLTIVFSFRVTQSHNICLLIQTTVLLRHMLGDCSASPTYREVEVILTRGKSMIAISSIMHTYFGLKCGTLAKLVERELLHSICVTPCELLLGLQIFNVGECPRIMRDLMAMLKQFG